VQVKCHCLGADRRTRTCTYCEREGPGIHFTKWGPSGDFESGGPQAHGVAEGGSSGSGRGI
jgi:hypothetical protein